MLSGHEPGTALILRAKDATRSWGATNKSKFVKYGGNRTGKMAQHGVRAVLELMESPKTRVYIPLWVCPTYLLCWINLHPEALYLTKAVFSSSHSQSEACWSACRIRFISGWEAASHHNLTLPAQLMLPQAILELPPLQTPLGQINNPITILMMEVHPVGPLQMTTLMSTSLTHWQTVRPKNVAWTPLPGHLERVHRIL